MKRGAILEAAHRDTRTGFAGAVILVLLSAGVLAFNWKYVYRFVAGAHEWASINLFVLGASIVLPIGIVWTIVAFRSRIDLERYPPIAGLKRFGHPSYVIESIEKEFATAGASSYVAPVWIAPSWIVRLEPNLQIFKLSTIVAAAYVTGPGKGSNPPTQAVRVWIVGEQWPTDVHMSEKEARSVLASLGDKVAGVVQPDAAAFEKRWKHDQDGCERDAKARKPLKRSA